MKKPSLKTLNDLDMSSVLDFIPKSDTNLVYIDEVAGKEHYRLLTWLGKKVKGEIVELGTFRGHSAVCLSIGGVTVKTFDIQDHISLTKKPTNVDFVLSGDGHLSITDVTKVIFLDTMHDGTYERVVLDYLRSISWKGMLIMDDIVLFPELAKLWAEISERKEDWTDIGHHSGTGIVYFE